MFCHENAPLKPSSYVYVGFRIGNTSRERYNAKMQSNSKRERKNAASRTHEVLQATHGHGHPQKCCNASRRKLRTSTHMATCGIQTT